MKSIAIIGNSIACGYRSDGWEHIDSTLDRKGRATEATNYVSNGWVQQFREYKQRTDPEFVLYNLSGDGWTTREHIDRKTLKLLSKCSPAPDYAMVALSIVDRLKDDGTISGGLSYYEYIANTVYLISGIANLNIKPVLVKENYVDMWGGKGFAPTEYTAMAQVKKPGSGLHRCLSDYVGIYNTLAHIFDCEVVEFYEAMRGRKLEYGMIGNTGIYDVWHPGQKGHDLMFREVLKWSVGKR